MAHETIKARLYPWPSGKRPLYLLTYSIFARKWSSLTQPSRTGIQGYLAHTNPLPVGPYSSPMPRGTYMYGDPRGVGVSYERGTPVHGGHVGFTALSVLLRHSLGGGA